MRVQGHRMAVRGPAVRGQVSEVEVCPVYVLYRLDTDIQILVYLENYHFFGGSL
jgi:hypothetical protein